eukprot:3692201-Amphidinium_carterae.1
MAGEDSANMSCASKALAFRVLMGQFHAVSEFGQQACVLKRGPWKLSESNLARALLARKQWNPRAGCVQRAQSYCKPFSTSTCFWVDDTNSTEKLTQQSKQSPQP